MKVPEISSFKGKVNPNVLFIVYVVYATDILFYLFISSVNIRGMNFWPSVLQGRIRLQKLLSFMVL